MGRHPQGCSVGRGGHSQHRQKGHLPHSFVDSLVCSDGFPADGSQVSNRHLFKAGTEVPSGPVGVRFIQRGWGSLLGHNPNTQGHSVMWEEVVIQEVFLEEVVGQSGSGRKGGEGPQRAPTFWPDASLFTELPHTPSDGQPRASSAAGQRSGPTWGSCAHSSSAPSGSRWTCGGACWSWSTTPWRSRSTAPATCSPLPGRHPWARGWGAGGGPTAQRGWEPSAPGASLPRLPLGWGCGSWEQEKSRRALKWREEQRKESYTKDDSEKDSDTGDDQPDLLEPPEVAAARESIAALVGEQKNLRKQKVPRVQGPGQQV